MLKINPGTPHFKGIVNQCRSASYNFDMMINEFIDNIIKKCTEIKIKTLLDSESNRLYELRISDNYSLGFENILESGISNPFNMTHIRDGQLDDSETSEFGIGMKAAAICMCNKFTIVTKTEKEYLKVEFDIIKMINNEIITNK